MSIIFEVTDKTGRRIRLTKKQWDHITSTHGEMTDYLEIMQITLTKPLKIIPQEKGNLFRYYSYQKNRKHLEKYLRIVVKYLNGDGFIITSHFVRSLQ